MWLCHRIKTNDFATTFQHTHTQVDTIKDREITRNVKQAATAKRKCVWFDLKFLRSILLSISALNRFQYILISFGCMWECGQGWEMGGWVCLLFQVIKELPFFLSSLPLYCRPSILPGVTWCDSIPIQIFSEICQPNWKFNYELKSFWRYWQVAQVAAVALCVWRHKTFLPEIIHRNLSASIMRLVCMQCAARRII